MIAPMTKVTFLGPKPEKERFLRRLQEVGVTHLILPAEAQEPMEIKKELGKVNGARRFLAKQLAAPTPAPAPKDLPPDWAENLKKLEDLKNREERLRLDLAFLKREESRCQIWGEFRAEDLNHLRKNGLDIKFYRMPLTTYTRLEHEGVVFSLAGTRKEEAAVAALSTQPIKIDRPEEADPVPLSRLAEELKAKSGELDSIQAEYRRLAAGVEDLVQMEVDLQNQFEFERASRNAESALEDRLFMIQCWTPTQEEQLIREIGPGFTFYHIAGEADPGDRVPVHLQNSPVMSPGEDLVKVYSHPNTSDFDPSGIVFYCFAVFFGMILGDFGYGAILFGLTAFINMKVKDRSDDLKRFLRLSYLLSLSTMAFGAMGASYFGIPLAQDNILQKLLVLDLSTPQGQSRVMLVSIFMGMIHISISLAIKVYRAKDMPSLGWIIAIWAGYFMIDGEMGSGGGMPVWSKWAMIGGLGLVLLFTSDSRNPIIRILLGLNGLLGIIQLFSDVLSYLRLFALGLSTYYMMLTFNTLAKSAVEGLPYVGYVLAVIILVGGHAINLVLGVMGGVIHGLRLNFLEWYRWCFEGDGLPFKPFKRIEYQRR